MFDPQGVAGEQPTWWWNPLSYVTDEVKAAQLAEHFAAGGRDPGAKVDAYFDPAAQDLLAGLLLAAAVNGQPITRVYSWLTRPTDDTAVAILQTHDYPLTADHVAGVIAAPDKQRGGVYGTAQQLASCLTNRAVARWITPQGGPYDPLPQFDPHAFTAGTDTLYSLSVEGRGNAGPLVTALTVAVTEAPPSSPPGPSAAGSQCRCSASSTRPPTCAGGGSCRTGTATSAPAASSSCRSCSRGLRAARCGGSAGMKKLWSAGNIKVYRGGVHEDPVLR